MNASCDDGLVPSVVREAKHKFEHDKTPALLTVGSRRWKQVAFLQSLARMRHSSFVRLLEVEAVPLQCPRLQALSVQIS